MATNGEVAVSAFDKILGNLHGLPEVTHTKPTTVRALTPLLGQSELYIIQTYRQKDEGDIIFLEAVMKDGTVRLALPPAVADAISRQRDALTGKSRSRASKAVMQARIQRGDAPTFKRKQKSR